MPKMFAIVYLCVFVGDIGADHNTSQCVRSSQCPMFGMRTIISAIVIVENPLCLLSRRSRRIVHARKPECRVQSSPFTHMWPAFPPTNKNTDHVEQRGLLGKIEAVMRNAHATLKLNKYTRKLRQMSRCFYCEINLWPVQHEMLAGRAWEEKRCRRTLCVCVFRNYTSFNYRFAKTRVNQRSLLHIYIYI